MFGFFKRKPKPVQRRTYEIAKASRHFDYHFLYADGSDADTLIEQSLETLRNRCRYEIRNNTYAEGMAETLANDIIGSGPRLQLKTSDKIFNREVEKRWLEYGAQCDLAGKMEIDELLRLDIRSLCENGESFTVIGSDPDAAADELFTKFLTIEPDRINSPLGDQYDDDMRQGIKVNAYGRPLLYYVQKEHPGSGKIGASYSDYDQIPAEQMIHLLKICRAGQTRGVPWLVSALPLFAHLRSFTSSTVKAARRAAGFTTVMQAEGPLGSEDDVESLETIDVEEDQCLILPDGRTVMQLKPEHPAATYVEFKHELINEIARGIQMPYNVAAANSSGYNYASGRLDWQVYYRNIAVIQRWIGRRKLNRIFQYFLTEAQLRPGYIPAAPADFRVSDNTVAWYWPGTEHVDPAKEANAEAVRLQSGTLTLAAAYARQGKDWELELEQIAREQEKIKELGLTLGGATNAQKQTENNEPDDEDENGSDRTAFVRYG